MRWTISILAVAGAAALLHADVASGPKAGDKVAKLEVFATTGEPKEKTLDYSDSRKEKPTIYVFIQGEHFSRPIAQFMRKLDEAMPDISEHAYVVTVLLSDNSDMWKDRLPKVDMSLMFKATALTVFTGEKSGPKDWGVNADAHVTAVVVNKAKVIQSFGYMSINATDAPAVIDELKKALK
jgi:hypothetical protein